MTTLVPSKPNLSRRLRRGFTLVELLIVVAIIGIFAALATVGYRKYMSSAQSSEAAALLQGIRAAQEAYRAETLTYLDCDGGPGSFGDYTPRSVASLATNGNVKANLLDVAGSNATSDCFRTLNVQSDGAVYFVYAVDAGLPTDSYPSDPGNLGEVSSNWGSIWPASPPDPWFIAVAFADRDIDGQLAGFATSSFSGEVFRNLDHE